MIDDILTMDDVDLKGKTVLVRVDLNSPTDPMTRKLTDVSRIKRHVKTIKDLYERGAKVVLLTHQGDPFDELENFIEVKQHAEILTKMLSRKVSYIDDTFGPAARKAIMGLTYGEILLLENTRFFSEDTRRFEDEKEKTPKELAETILVQKLYPLVDIFVNDAFSASHRCQPSTVGFSQVLPSIAGRVMEDEIRNLSAIVKGAEKPCVFCLGGVKISDRFKMMEAVLEKGIVDILLTCGIIGQLMLKASGYSLGSPSEAFIEERGFTRYVRICKKLLKNYSEGIKFPVDLAVEQRGRLEVDTASLPVDALIRDIGKKTAKEYSKRVLDAKTVLVCGPPGTYEKEEFEYGTRAVFRAAATSKAFTVAGGGNTNEALIKFGLFDKFSYVSTGGGALVRYLSGEKLAGIEALQIHQGNSLRQYAHSKF